MGTFFPVIAKSETSVVSFFPSDPAGWLFAKSSGEKFLASSRDIASASPTTRKDVVDVVGAKLWGQASSRIFISIWISDAFAMEDFLEFVIEQTLFVFFLNADGFDQHWIRYY